MRPRVLARLRGSSARILLCAIAVMVNPFFSGNASAQSTLGSFTGTVHDPAGAPVPSCIVSLLNKGTSIKRDIVTDANGSYLFVNVEPGMYDLVFQAPGFQRSTVTGFELLARQSA